MIVTNRRTGHLAIAERPIPEPVPGELLVRVHAAGVNPSDWKMRSGMIGRLAARVIPAVPGVDVAGMVEAVGPHVARRPQRGLDSSTIADRRAFLCGSPILGCTGRGGGYAEWALVPQAWTALKPDALSFVEAAAIPVPGLVALQALRDRARLSPGQRLLVNGASGGVGTFAVQIARVLGARITAVTSAPNRELVTDLGAELVIDYTVADFTRLADRYDVIFDAVANRSYSECARRLAPRGVYVTTLPRPTALGWLLLTRLGADGGRRVVIAGVRPSADDLAYLAELAAAGQIRPVIERVLPLADANAAWDASRNGHVHGKLILSPDTIPAE